MKEDTKILLAVVGFVVVGAAGIALVGALSLERQSASNEIASLTPPPEIEAAPATYIPDVRRSAISGASDTVGETTPVISPEIVVDEAKPFEVQPGEDFIARGLETYQTREFDKAAAYFKAATEERPGRAWSHYMLSLSLWKNGEHGDAVVEMERSAEIDGGSVKTFVNLARIQNDRGEFEAALDAARLALTDDPDSAEALFLEGRSLHNLNRHEEAVESLAKSIEIEPDNGWVQNVLGLSLLELDRADQALEAFRIAAEVRPDVAIFQNNLGMALERDGQSPEAAEAYRVAVSLDPGHDKAVANLARLEPSIVGMETVTVEAEVGEAFEIADADTSDEEVEAP